MNNNKKQKKKNPLALIVVIVMLISSLVGNENLERFWQRLVWSFRTGRLPSGRILAIAAAAVVILVAIILAARAPKRVDRDFGGARVRGGASASGGGTASVHSHDRLQGYRGDESGYDHWKKQLDGFLAAGIIDRAEYRVLLERRRR